jgi:outer membrane protein TolC
VTVQIALDLPGRPAAESARTLPDCIQLALENQPALAAQRASLAAANDNQQALENLRVPDIIARELPVRRKQAALGVQAAAAGLEQAERDTIYAVTRTYYTVVYARQQRQVANELVQNLTATREIADRLEKQGVREVTTASVDRATIYLSLAQTRLDQAEAGVERATAALREAMGLPPGSCLVVADDHLPDPPCRPSCRADIVNLALSRRGELVQAGSLAEATNLEVDAQATSHRAKMGTFAAGADIHSREVPPGIADGEYRPGAVAPEMPTLLAGSRSARVERARSFSARAAAVADKTRGLIALEAEDAYLRWEEASRKVPRTQSAATKANKLAVDQAKDYGTNGKVKTEDLIAAQVFAAQVQSQHVESLFQKVLALAALERITGGGFCAGFSAPVTTQMKGGQ